MGENSCGEENRVGVAMRWTTDPGAIPGEPYDYLDFPIEEDGEIGEAKAVIIEIDTPAGSRWEARAFGGRVLGMFDTRIGETRSENRSEERRVGKECRSRWSP